MQATLQKMILLTKMEAKIASRIVKGSIKELDIIEHVLLTAALYDSGQLIHTYPRKTCIADPRSVQLRAI